MVSKIESILKEKFLPVHLELRDESEKHGGHAGVVMMGGGHYLLVIVSAAFLGKPLIERHRMIYEVLEKELEENIHAIQIKAMAPDEWKKGT